MPLIAGTWRLAERQACDRKTTGSPMAIEPDRDGAAGARTVALTRHVRIELEDDDADWNSAALLVPAGSTDVQVIQWAAQCLAPEHLAVLRSAIEASK